MSTKDTFHFGLYAYRSASPSQKHAVLRSEFVTQLQRVRAYVELLGIELHQHPDILPTSLHSPLPMIRNDVSALLERLQDFNPDVTPLRDEWLDLLATLQHTTRTLQQFAITLANWIPELSDWPYFQAQPSNQLEALLDVLTDPHFSIPKHIAEWLEVYAALSDQANAGNHQALIPLITALTNPERTIRVEAAHLLRKIANQQSIEPLIHALQDPDWEVRVTSIETLADVGDTRAIAPLLQMLAQELAQSSYPDGAGRMIGSLCRTLCTLSSSVPEPVWEQCLTLLLNNLNDPEHAARSGAGWGFRAFRDQRALKPIIATIKAVPQSAMRGGFLHALEDIGGPDAVAARAWYYAWERTR